MNSNGASPEGQEIEDVGCENPERKVKIAVIDMDLIQVTWIFKIIKTYDFGNKEDIG